MVYRRKGTVEAIRWTGDSDPVRRFLTSHDELTKHSRVPLSQVGEDLLVFCAYRNMWLRPESGDWIVAEDTGVDVLPGELFRERYEPA